MLGVDPDANWGTIASVFSAGLALAGFVYRLHRARGAVLAKMAEDINHQITEHASEDRQSFADFQEQMRAFAIDIEKTYMRKDREMYLLEVVAKFVNRQEGRDGAFDKQISVLSDRIGDLAGDVKDLNRWLRGNQIPNNKPS